MRNQTENLWLAGVFCVYLGVGGGGSRGFLTHLLVYFLDFFQPVKSRNPPAQLRLQADMCSSNTNYSLSQTPVPQLGSVVSQKCVVRSVEVPGGGL